MEDRPSTSPRCGQPPEWARGLVRMQQQASQFVQQLAANVTGQRTAPQLHQQHSQGSRIVRFPSPFASITDPGPPPSMNPSSFRKARPAGGDASKPKAGDEQQERILISEVEVQGVDGELKRAAQAALTIRPNLAYTLKEVEDDLQKVFATGWFANVQPDAEDTRDGVKLFIKVKPNPELRSVVATGSGSLPTSVMQEAFAGLHGKTLNFASFARAVEKVDRWYRSTGVLGQVVDFTFQGGAVELNIGEAHVGKISLQFVDAKTGDVKEVGATKPDVILRHFNTRPGKVYNLRQAKQDIDSVYSTGLFDDVNIIPNEADDSTELQPKVDLTINLVERKTGGLGAGTGISAQGRGEGALPGFVGSFTYSQRNLFGLGQRLSALAELGQTDKVFRLQHVDPWLMGDPYRTSRTIQLLNNRTTGGAVHGPIEEDPSSAGEDAASQAFQLVLGRTIAGAEWRRPLSRNWSGTFGVTWQRTTCMDEHGQSITQDCYGGPLTYSGGASDTMMVGQVSAAYNSPHDAAQVMASLEQSMPLSNEWLNFNRLRLRAEAPLQMGPVGLNLRAKGGAIYGDLPPYEAFPIGGTNSVRGYGEGGVGSGRHFTEASAELRFPIVKPLNGTLFFDYGTDFDSGDKVIGDPAGARGKPGKGYGYGAGIRVDSPLGPFRLEYAWNDQMQRRFHVGLGYD